MGYFDSQIITTEGTELLARADAGEKITFTSVRLGDGEYSLSEMAGLDERAELKSEKQQFPVNGLSVKQNTVCIKSVISNAGLSTGYYIREIGIFAKGESGTEVMFAVSICTGNAATFLPAFQSVPIEIPFTDRISYMGSKESLQIEYASDVYASLADVEETIDNRMTERLGGIGHSTRPVYFNTEGVPVPVSYTLQSACTRHYTDTVTQGSQYLPTSNAVYNELSKKAYYEEGTWTPQLMTYALSESVGYYTRIGNLCFLQGAVRVKNDINGTFVIYNPPFFTGTSDGESARRWVDYLDQYNYTGDGSYSILGRYKSSNNVSASKNGTGSNHGDMCCTGSFFTLVPDGTEYGNGANIFVKADTYIEFNILFGLMDQ